MSNRKKRKGTTRKPREQASVGVVPLSTAIAKRLLSFGGNYVVWLHDDQHAQLLLTRGKLFTQRVRLRRGESNGCHTSAAVLWAQDLRRNQLVIGYALAHGNWVSHAWVFRDERTVYETTHRYDQYFGAVLTPPEALNFLLSNYPGALCKPPKFWAQFPGLIDLILAVNNSQQGFESRLVAQLTSIPSWKKTAFHNGGENVA